MTTIPYEEALATRHPSLTLRSHIEVLLRDGVATREQILEALSRTRLEAREEGDEVGEDLVTEVMDFLTGWCSPRLKL